MLDWHFKLGKSNNCEPKAQAWDGSDLLVSSSLSTLVLTSRQFLKHIFVHSSALGSERPSQKPIVLVSFWHVNIFIKTVYLSSIKGVHCSAATSCERWMVAMDCHYEASSSTLNRHHLGLLVTSGCKNPSIWVRAQMTLQVFSPSSAVNRFISAVQLVILT